MTSKDFLRGLGALHARQILEADGYEAPRARPWVKWAALAACVALVAAAAWQLLPYLTTETAPPSVGTEQSSPDSGALPGPAGDGETAEDGTAEHSAGETLGGVALGMTQQEVEAVLGSDYEATDPREQAENYRDICWYYPGISVRFVDEGAGWFVQELMVQGDSDMTLSTGIGLDSTREEILAAYPDAQVTEDGGLWSAYVEQANGGLWITLDAENGSYISMAAVGQESTEILTTESIGGLKLGMTQQEVEAVLGTDYQAYAVREQRKYFKTVDWWYSEVQLTFADTGDGWFLNKIVLGPESTLTLSAGIGMASTEAEVRAAYPDAREIVEDSDPYSDGIASRYLLVGSPDSGLRFYLDGDALFEIRLGDLAPEPEPLYNLLSAGTIVVRGEDGTEVTLIDKAAKLVSTTLTISDPEPASYPGETPKWWLDFGNGTYLAVYGHDDLATVYSGDGLDTTLATMTEELTGVFVSLDSNLESALENPTETWE